MVFPSVAYLIQWESCPAAGWHKLVAHDRERGVWPFIGPAYRARAFLEAAVFQVGVPVAPATIGAVIMRRLLLEGRADKVPSPAPADDPATWLPAARPYLGTWLDGAGGIS